MLDELNRFLGGDQSEVVFPLPSCLSRVPLGFPSGASGAPANVIYVNYFFLYPFPHFDLSPVYADRFSWPVLLLMRFKENEAYRD